MPLRSIFLFFLFFACFAGDLFAQSGRVKPNETPSPSPTPKKSVYIPTIDRPRVTPTPTPKKDDDEVFKVESRFGSATCLGDGREWTGRYEPEAFGF